MYAFYKGAPFLSYLNPYASQFNYATALAKSWLYPLINQVISKPDLATIALLLVIILVSLKILDMLWQSVKFWLKMAWRVAFYGGLAALGLWFWTRGPEGVAEDVQYLSQTFSKEHQYWLEQERSSTRMARQRPAYGRAGDRRY